MSQIRWRHWICEPKKNSLVQGQEDSDMTHDTGHNGPAALADRRAQAEASIRAKNRRREAMGHGLMSGFAAFGQATTGTGLMARLTKLATWFLIWFAFIVPILLVIQERF
jgi:hypothetical protein